MELSIKKNLFWDYFNRFGTTLIGLLTSIILSRILNPSEFGIVGIAMAVNAIGGIFLNLGFVNGIIQSKNINDKMLSTAFYINLFMAFFIYFGIFISSKWISEYFGLSELDKILKISAIAFLFNAMSLISYAQLNREMKFKLIAIVDLISALISGIVGVYLALNNYGVWSIVIQQLLNSILLFFCFVIIKKWIPILYFKFSSISSLYNFGKFLFLSNLIETIYSRFDILVIAKIFNVNTLGLYTRAQGLESTIRNLSSSSLLNVLFPAFSLIKENLNLLRQSYYKYFELICFLFYLFAGIFFIFSDQLFLILFGTKWSLSSDYFKLMILAGFSFPLCNLGVSIIQSRGNSKSVLSYEILKRIIQIPSYLIAFFYGLKAFLICFIFLGFVNTILNIILVNKEIEISLIKTSKILLNYLIPSILIVFVIQYSQLNFFQSSIIFFKVIYEVIIYIFFYLTFHFITKSESLFMIINYFKNKFN